MTNKKTTKSTRPVTNDNVVALAQPQTSLTVVQEAIKAVSILAASILFAAPAFATQANPQNILALTDMFYRYATGDIAVAQAPDVDKAPAAPTFG